MRKIVIASLLIAGLFAACGNAAPRASASGGGSEAGGMTAGVPELPLPDVPATLRTPVDRANYIVGHFWDAMDFRDTLRGRDIDFIEQNFANFASVFPYASAESRSSAVSGLMKRAEVDKESYLVMADTAEKYLYDPNSPMLNEDFYLCFLDELLSSALLDSYEKIRYGYQREAVLKNRAGMPAADFAFLTREGRRSNLHSVKAGEFLLLIFYDPDCEHCKEIMSAIESDPVIGGMTASGRVSVLAVYSGEDRKMWDERKGSLPAGWTVAIDTSDLEERGLYVLRAMPTLYLLDSSKKVIFKDIQPAALSEWLASLE